MKSSGYCLVGVDGDLSPIVPVVITLNEAANLERCLRSLSIFPRVIVLDSGSTDETLEIARSFENVEVVARSFDSFAGQWNYALKVLVKTGWMLRMDADYSVSADLLEEMRDLDLDSDVVAFSIGFDFAVLGRRLRCSLYPDAVCLHRVDVSSYFDDGHCQRVLVSGKIGRMYGKMLHDDRKPFRRWLQSQVRYAELEAARVHSSGCKALSAKIRKLIVVAPILFPLYVFIFRLGFLDGYPGLYYCMQRAVAELIIAMNVVECRVKSLCPGARLE